MASASSYIVCPFPDFNWLIKILATFGLARQVLIWVQHMKITGRVKVVLIFWVYVKVGNSWKQRYILSLALKWKISAGKKNEKICFKYGLHQHLCNEPQTLQPLVQYSHTMIFSYPKVKPGIIYTRIDCIQDHFILKVMALSWRFTLDCNRVLAGSCRNNSLISIKIRTNSNSFLSKSTSEQKCSETQNGRIYWSGGI